MAFMPCMETSSLPAIVFKLLHSCERSCATARGPITKERQDPIRVFACITRLCQIRLPMGLIALSLIAGCTDAEFGSDTSRPTSEAQHLAQLRYDLKQDPNDIEALKKIGDMQAGRGQWSQAMGAYREALVVSPNDRDALLGYGEGQLALGDYGGALETVKAIPDQQVRVLLLRAGALAGLNRLTEARAVLELARKGNPRDLDVRSNLAIVSALSHDPQAYPIARAAAFAPDASYSHRRNLVLVGGIAGQEAAARQDGTQLGIGSDEITQIIAIGRRARTEGIRAFGILAGA
ncbi:tetratricopeptide repeat protein [Paracoccus alkanivorans]|uniref:Uncharacterized protein n=1 Tax=Paracoccus alkanivorans TaxID=2116655 RepID=A0A3M0MUE3_9RHOB|nr:tetratricopeptide repeat protein [Paracoccus alkanivorans]RMC34927.1 hypothetical protein C9E81_12625 [Paracoccus alkanivorans]